MPDTHYTEWFRFRSSALPEDAFHVIRFTGTEGLNRLFSFTIELASPNADIDAEAMLAAEAEFAILRQDAPDAVFRGFPARVAQGGHFGDYTFYTVELRPAFWKLTRLVGSAVFLNKKIREAAAEVLHSQQFFQFEHEFRLTRDYPAPEFAMQYQESLYDYILFRMEEQGAYFYFAPDGDRVIFADAPQSHKEAAAKLSYSPASGLDYSRREEVLQSFIQNRAPLPRQVVVRCYDWKDPNRVIVGKAEVSAKGMGDVYLAGENAESQEEADRLAKIRAEELACRGAVFTGSGSVPVLRPGVVFSLDKHYSASFNRDYMVTEIRHEGSQEAYITLGLGIPMQGAPDHYFYRNEFSCIPSDVPYRPERTAPRAKISGVLRAFVDGAGNKRAEMDEYGRYKLVFPFDRSGRKGGNASCWIRMAGPQAGKDSGLAFPLLPGTEVVVSFIDGNPDRPVITGALVNGESGSISGRGNADISGIRTAGGNQITINDADKKQGIALTTAAGLGYSISSGSLAHSSETADTVLKAVSVGGAEVAGAFKDVATGFKITNVVYEDPAWYGWLSTAAAALAGTAGAAMDSLSDDAVGGETVKWVSSGVKALVPVTEMIDKIMTTIDSGRGTYGASLSADADVAASSVQVRPSAAKLTGVIAGWIGGRLAAQGTDLAKDIVKITDNSAAHAEDDYNRVMTDAVNNLKEYEDYKGSTYEYADDGQKYANVSHDLDELIEAMKLAGADASKLSKLEALRKDLEAGWAKYKDVDSDDYYKNAKMDAARHIVTSTTEELLPEIAALVALIIGRVNQAKQLGGVSVASSDNNVNIRAKHPISAHSKGGILLETKLDLNDAGAWGIKGPSPLDAAQDLNAAGKVKWFGKDAEKPTGDYVVAHTDTLGLFANKVRAVAATDWVSVIPTHLLKSSDADAPNAQLKMTDADKIIEAKVAAAGKIVLNRGEADNGQTLTLANDECILKNGKDVKHSLGRATATLATKGCALQMYSDNLSLRAKNADVKCKQGEIAIDPGGGGTVKLGSMVSVKNSEVKANGVLQLAGSMIKIG